MKFLTQMYSSTSGRFSHVFNEIIQQWTLELPGSGCEYCKKSGGCTMCGFHVATSKYSHGFLYPSALFSFLYKQAEKETLLYAPRKLAIFNGGSFWNDHEIPAEFQKNLYRMYEKHPTLQQLMIETRCEYISAEKIQTAQERIGGKILTVAIGLESQDDHVRNVLIKKGLARKLFEEKVALLKNKGVMVQAYVFLKPLGLNEEEAFQETLKTIEYSLSRGADEIVISCAFVQKGTPLETAYNQNDFKPPSLWTIVELIREISRKNWPVSIGGFTDNPKPIAAPSSCPRCFLDVSAAIEAYRYAGVFEEIPRCSCSCY